VRHLGRPLRKQARSGLLGPECFREPYRAMTGARAAYGDDKLGKELDFVNSPWWDLFCTNSLGFLLSGLGVARLKCKFQFNVDYDDYH
jgi:hypothetical protein